MARESLIPFYRSKAWQKQRTYILMRDHFTCTEPGCYNAATEVHHIVELNEANVYDTSIALDEHNLRSLCHDCHTRITSQMKASQSISDCLERIVFDIDGYPISESELMTRLVERISSDTAPSSNS